MSIKEKKVTSSGIKFFIEDHGIEIARTYLYLMHNDLHQEPFGLIEDVFVHQDHRQKKLGSQLLKQAIAKSKELNCYKLICTTRHSKSSVQEWYQREGFKNHGLEFRIDF